MSDEPLDPAVIRTLRQLTQVGQPDVVIEVLTLFRAVAPERISAIHDAVAARDAAALHRTAHDFKGASGTIGALRLQQCCRDLETIGKSGDFARGSELLDALAAEYARVDAAISALLGNRA